MWNFKFKTTINLFISPFSFNSFKLTLQGCAHVIVVVRVRISPKLIHWSWDHFPIVQPWGVYSFLHSWVNMCSVVTELDFWLQIWNDTWTLFNLGLWPRQPFMLRSSVKWKLTPNRYNRFLGSLVWKTQRLVSSGQSLSVSSSFYFQIFLQDVSLPGKR